MFFLKKLDLFFYAKNILSRYNDHSCLTLQICVKWMSSNGLSLLDCQTSQLNVMGGGVNKGNKLSILSAHVLGSHLTRQIVLMQCFESDTNTK